MNYIDKSKNGAAGNQIIDRLLEDSWNDEENHYNGADYEGLSKTNYRPGIVSLMLDEQNNLCCYCLKTIGITDIDTTLEHIIPHKVKEIDFVSYLVVKEFINVIYKNSFDRNTLIIPPAQYPHDIAYFNLIASCNSNANCNHFRGNDFIYPFIFDPNIETKVEYDDEGIANSDDYFEALASTGVSISPELKMYRKIWKLLSLEKDSPDEVTDDDIEMIILTLDGDSKFTKTLSNFYGQPSKKDELLKYKWFFHYYK